MNFILQGFKHSCFPQVLDKYAAVFPAVWIASAFKGATGSDKYITDISKYELLIQ